jgi:catechol 2,3-dioxygenase-like lactoylglutathione lyase family enzyme
MKTMKMAAVLMLTMAAPVVAQGARRPAIVGISHVTLRAADLGKSREFYSRVLGLAEEPAGNSQRARFRINDHQYVELVTAGADAPADRMIEVGFETKNAEALRRYLGGHGVKVPEQVTEEKGGTRSFDVRDPEDHQICFEQFGTGTAGGASAHPISAHMIHAGFIVRDRAAETAFTKTCWGFICTGTAA